MWTLIFFISFQIFLYGCILGAISGSTYVTFVDASQLIGETESLVIKEGKIP